MMGIYKFTNLKNNLSYIGQSISLENRYNQHYNNHKNKKLHDYYTDFYKALREFGFENFSYEILEQKDYYSPEELNEREKYWISYYNSYYNGYNMNPGGENVTENGENHPMAKLTNQQVLEIKHILKTRTDLTQYEIANQFGVQQSVISEINEGKAWTTIGIESHYPLRKQGIMRTGSKHPRSILTDEQVLKIRERYVNESGHQIYESYKDIISYTAFERILLGKTYTNLPIYKKKLKKWINIQPVSTIPQVEMLGSRATISTQLDFRKRSL